MAKKSKKKNRPQEKAGTPQLRSSSATQFALTANRLFQLQIVVIMAAVLWIYWPVLHGDRLWDDDMLVFKNAVVQDPAGLWKIWFEPAGNLVDYFPLKVSVEWLEWHLWGDNTLGYHLTSIALHIASALLIWHLFSKLGLRFAWLGGLLFVVHPIVVESVAWMAELKNTLSLPPFLLAMIFYLDYDAHGKYRDYWLALGFFLAAMLCKTSMIMFPLVILLHAWWKRGRIGINDLKISAPFFLVSATLGLATVWFLYRGYSEHQGVVLGGFFSRLALAGLSIAFYFSKCLLPIGLSPLYPKWIIDPPSPFQFLPWLILGGMIYLLWTKRTNWGRHALLGLGFFLLNLLPFAGFTAGSYMDFTWVMDHLLYIPLIGLIGLAVAGSGQIWDRISREARPLAAGIAAAIILVFAWGSHTYAQMYVNEETLWSYTIRQNPKAWLAYNNLGFALARSGRLDDAIAQYEQALALNPNYVGTHSYLGLALSEEGRFPEAIAHYERALKLNPRYAEAHNNLGNAYIKVSRISDAISHFQQAIQINPNYADAHYNLGNCFLRIRQFPDAIEQFQLAIKNDPGNADAYNNLGIAYIQINQIPEATAQFQNALKLDPNNPNAQKMLEQLAPSVLKK